MEFLQAVYQCRELSSAILHLISPETSVAVHKALQQCSGPITRLQLVSTNAVSDHIAQVVSLVLKDVEHPDFCYLNRETTSGLEALQAIQLALFGCTGSGETHLSFMKAVLFGTTTQAQYALDFCVAALLESISVSNCLSVFNIAASCKSSTLRERALNFGLQHFSDAAQLDYAGLTQLSLPNLIAILRSDELQVTSELEVFNALATWISYDPATRMHGFVQQLASTVRLPHLSASDLVFLDSHPLVEKDKMALQLVAYAYLSKATGVACNLPFGLTTITRPRSCYWQPTGPPSSRACSSESAGGCSSSSCSAGAPCTQTVGSRGVAGQRNTSALANLVQALNAAQPVNAAPDTPLPTPPAGHGSAFAPSSTQACAQDADPSSLPLLILDAATPLVRTASQSPPSVPQHEGRARDMVGVGAAPTTRRSLFSASPGPACTAGASAPIGSRVQSPDCRGAQCKGGCSRANSLHQQTSAAAPEMRSSRAGGASQPAKLSSCFALEMALSPTKAGIRQWLDTAEAEAAPEVWPSKKRLRFN